MTIEHPIFQHLPYYKDISEHQLALAAKAPSPEEIRLKPHHIRKNFALEKLRRDWFHFGYDQYRIAEMIQSLILGRYSKIEYESASDNASFYGHDPSYNHGLVGLIAGNGGVGKSISVFRTLKNYKQIIELPHKHLVNPLPHVVWFSLELKATSPKDFALALVNGWNDLFLKHYPNSPPPIPQKFVEKDSMEKLLERFITSAKNYRLGLLHIDEIQNLFSVKMVGGKNIISAAEEKILKKTLSFLNSSFSVLLTCTPDGVEGLNKRVSISQRSGINQIILRPYSNDKSFRKFMKDLWQYQYVDGAIELNQEILDLFYSKTAGFPRLIVSAFITAQKNVLDIPSKTCPTFEDFAEAFDAFSEDIRMTVLATLNKRDDILSSKVDYNRNF